MDHAKPDADVADTRRHLNFARAMLSAHVWVDQTSGRTARTSSDEQQQVCALSKHLRHIYLRHIRVVGLPALACTHSN